VSGTAARTSAPKPKTAKARRNRFTNYYLISELVGVAGS